MRVLLDTHALIWGSVTPDRLSAVASRVLQDRRNELHVSIASIWEISIKLSKPQNLLTLPVGWSESTEKYMSDWGLSLLPIRLEHCKAVRALPWRRHRDPFDRLLIAQAEVEKLRIVSRDESLRGYGVTVVW